MSDNLKPCPFCGGDAHAATTRYSRPLDDATWLDGTPITQAFFVSCVQCGSCTNVSVGRQTKAEAAAAWNTRADERPNATDYRNRGERDAAYWRDLCERMFQGKLIDRLAAIGEAEHELARINAEALR